MVDYREIVRLNSLKYTQRQIAASVHSSRNTISEVIKLAAENNLCWPLDDQLTNEKVYALLYPNKLEAVNPRKEPDYSYIHKALQLLCICRSLRRYENNQLASLSCTCLSVLWWSYPAFNSGQS